jgi:UDP-N-acetylmuramoylalanine--D-glutamate ligase
MSISQNLLSQLKTTEPELLELLAGDVQEIFSTMVGLELPQCETLEAAVLHAHASARSGDTIRLAPACASFDQFENFEHRGREFKRLVNALFAKETGKN